MTEDEWLVCEDESELAGLVLESQRASERTFRLFVAAFWGWCAFLEPPDRRTFWEEAAAYWGETGSFPDGMPSPPDYVSRAHQNLPDAVVIAINSLLFWDTSTVEAGAVQCALLRDIFGNPFRPTAIDPTWRTDTVLTLARTMYDARDFSAMPILADALGDAGCEDEAVLMHCRRGGPHFRGCHVIDALLNEE